MKIHISHRFSASARQYWDATRDPAYDAQLGRAAEVDFTVLAKEDRGAVAYARTRVSPRKELPLLAQKALGAARFTYVQENETNDGTMTTTWRVIPDVLSDKVKCSGVSRVIDVPGGCERIIEGELTVSIPFVGGTIEKHVMEQLERSYARGADVAREFLARASNA